MDQASLMKMVTQMARKLATMQEFLRTSERQEEVHNTPHTPKPHRRKRNGGSSSNGKRTRTITSPAIKKMRKKFKLALFQKIDARYLARKDPYKLYISGARGESLNLDKFLKIIRPLLHKLFNSSSEDKVHTVCFLTNNKHLSPSSKVFWTLLYNNLVSAQKTSELFDLLCIHLLH